MKLSIEPSRIQNHIFDIRGHRVMLDSHLAELYGVPTYRLNEQVKRNRRRFPDDFMFKLTREEALALRSHSAILKTGARGQHKKYLPHVLTEQGVSMLSSVLRSERAIKVNIAIMRAFVRVREILAKHEDLLKRLDLLEKSMTREESRSRKQARQIQAIFQAIHALIQGHEPKDQNVMSSMGFQSRQEG